MTYTSKTKHVDIETGEELTKYQTRQYIHINTKKHISYDKGKTRGYIEYTKQYTRNKYRQTELQFD